MSEHGFDFGGIWVVSDCRVPKDWTPNGALMIAESTAREIFADAPHSCAPDDRCDAWKRANEETA